MTAFTPTLRELLRYVYGGGLTIFSIGLLGSDSLTAALSNLESRLLLASTVALPLGAVVYAIHRSIANDYLFEPLAHLHRNRRGSECMLRHLQDMGVKGDLLTQLNTYRAVRDTCMTPAVRDRLHVQNSEITLIHLSFSIIGPVSLILFFRWLFSDFSDGRLVTIAVLIATGLLVLGANATARICRQQYVALRVLDPRDLAKVIQRIIPLTDVGCATRAPVRPAGYAQLRQTEHAMLDDALRERANHVRAELRALAGRLQAGDDSQLVVWVIPGELGVAHRPLRFHPVFGGSGQPLPNEATPEVICWVKRIIDQGFRAIICLMHPKEVAHYAKLDLGAPDLLALYRAKGLEVCHLPWEDPTHRSPDERAVFSEELARIRVQALDCFDKLPKPVLLHCSAGIDRSSPVCAYLHQERATDTAEHL